ncbi:MAG: hypothetical protein RI920_2248, partial [Pseudomonadota bacterium]
AETGRFRTHQPPHQAKDQQTRRGDAGLAMQRHPVAALEPGDDGCAHRRHQRPMEDAQGCIPDPNGVRGRRTHVSWRPLAAVVETARESEQRAADEHRRILLEVDRERGNAARVQKELDAVKSAAEKAAKAQADNLTQALQQFDQLRQRGAELELAQASLRAERDHLQKLTGSDDGERRTLTRLRSAGVAKVSARRRAR